MMVPSSSSYDDEETAAQAERDELFRHEMDKFLRTIKLTNVVATVDLG